MTEQSSQMNEEQFQFASYHKSAEELDADECLTKVQEV